MARKKKDKKRATGIQAKNGYLYISSDEYKIVEGKRVRKQTWITTGLKDTEENVKLAIEQRRKLIELKNKQAVLVDRNIDMEKYTEMFLEKSERTLADTTYSTYLQRSKHIRDHFSGIRVKDITTDMINTFFDGLLTKENPLAERTVRDIRQLLGKIMRKAVDDGIIAYSPVEKATINKDLLRTTAKEKQVDDKFFSYEEAQRFLDGVENNRWYEFFYFVLFFGLRREEALGLKWGAIDFNRKEMIINHTVTKGTKVNRVNAVKRDSSYRVFPLGDDQIAILEHLKKEEDRNRRLFGREYKENDYIFKNPDGSLYYPDSASNAFRKALRRMPDLPQHVTLHGLRSSCVSILVHENMDIKSIQNWAGHKDYETTLKHYAKVKDKEQKKEVANSMSRVIRAKTYKQDL